MRTTTIRTGGASPRWWVLLAVLLALMALVTAAAGRTGRSRVAGARVTSARGAGPGGLFGPGTAGATPPADTRPIQTPAGPSDPPPPRAAGPGPAPPASPAAQEQPAGPATAPAAGAEAGPGLAVTADLPSLSTASGIPGQGTGIGPTPSTPPGPTVDPGYLQYPDNVSAQYPVATGDSVAATATWTGSPTLSLALSCPGAQKSATGPSGLTVSVENPPSPGGTGTSSCTVTLSEPPGEEGTVSYSLGIRHDG